MTKKQESKPNVLSSQSKHLETVVCVCSLLDEVTHR